MNMLPVAQRGFAEKAADAAYRRDYHRNKDSVDECAVSGWFDNWHFQEHRHAAGDCRSHTFACVLTLNCMFELRRFGAEPSNRRNGMRTARVDIAEQSASGIGIVTGIHLYMNDRITRRRNAKSECLAKIWFRGINLKYPLHLEKFMIIS